MPSRLIASLVALTITSFGRTQAADEPAKPDTWDCGAYALYDMLQLEGRPTQLEEIRSILGAPGADGRSFLELREASRRCGLMLDAVVLPRKRSVIAGPILLFVKTQPEGHFVVVRPVGHTGRLVQWLDGDRPPIVLDADLLFASPWWTGLALVPHRINPIALVAGSLCAVLAVGFVALRWKRRRTRIWSPQIRRYDTTRAERALGRPVWLRVVIPG